MISHGVGKGVRTLVSVALSAALSATGFGGLAALTSAAAALARMVGGG